MLKIKEDELKTILPSDGPSINEVKKYLEKYNDEYIVIKCGGSVLIDKNLFDIFIKDIVTLNKLGLIPIIVHGGGKRISNKLNELGMRSISDKAEMKDALITLKGKARIRKTMWAKREKDYKEMEDYRSRNPLDFREYEEWFDELKTRLSEIKKIVTERQNDKKRGFWSKMLGA